MSDDLTSLKIPPLYGVYLLNSLVKERSYYIGSTPNPYRRLRQHNGELTRGGAYRTRRKGYRPWRMVMYVYGFPSNINALQFEHAWQHAYRTRHIPVNKRRHSGQKSTGSGTTIHEKLANCRLLLCSKSFHRLGLKVAIFSKKIYQAWIENKFHVSIPDSILMDLNFDTDAQKLEDQRLVLGGNYEQVKEFMDAVAKKESDYLDESLELIKDETPHCAICHSSLNMHTQLVGFCIFKDCKAVYHLQCWSQELLKQEDKKKSPILPVLPVRGKCIVCKRANFWNMIVRNSVSVKRKLQET